MVTDQWYEPERLSLSAAEENNSISRLDLRVVGDASAQQVTTAYPMVHGGMNDLGRGRLEPSRGAQCRNTAFRRLTDVGCALQELAATCATMSTGLPIGTAVNLTM